MAGPDQLLGELQLSFILFIQLTNFSALDVYKDILSLLCRSSVSPNDVDVYEQLLRILYSQLASLRTEFFVEDLPALESFYLDSLDSLRRSLKMVATAQSVIVEGWNRLAQMARDRYGWGLRQVSGYAKVQSGTTHYDLLPREGVGQQSDDEDLLAEEGEDAPVVVDL